MTPASTDIELHLAQQKSVRSEVLAATVLCGKLSQETQLLLLNTLVKTLPHELLTSGLSTEARQRIVEIVSKASAQLVGQATEPVFAASATSTHVDYLEAVHPTNQQLLENPAQNLAANNATQMGALNQTTDTSTPEYRYQNQEWRCYQLDAENSLIVGYLKISDGTIATIILHPGLMGLELPQAHAKHAALGLGGTLANMLESAGSQKLLTTLVLDQLDQLTPLDAAQLEMYDLLTAAFHQLITVYFVYGHPGEVFDDTILRFRPSRG